MCAELREGGLEALLGHLRLCGAIPEGYGHDSTEEKLYSKYTDIVIHQAFEAIGFRGVVLAERSDVADVECVGGGCDFVADAKAFRLSRTAKNQKDFKVEAMDSWKHGKPYAMVVCPAYQLPSRTSQIYRQSATRSVLITTYAHLSVLVRFAEQRSKTHARGLVAEMFRTVEAMVPSKDAAPYWQASNRTLLDFDPALHAMWRDEKIATEAALVVLKGEALRFLAEERARILALTREAAIEEVMKWRKLTNRTRVVKAVSNGTVLGFE